MACKVDAADIMCHCTYLVNDDDVRGLYVKVYENIIKERVSHGCGYDKDSTKST